MSRIADRNISEALIWHIWREQLSKLKHLKLTDGRTVRIHHPGILNADSGPDFLGAELSYGPGGRLRGDVEIHLRPSDWYRHGHDQDPRYNRVVLHIVMWTDNSLTMVRKYNRQHIPTLILSRHLQESLPHLRNIYQNKQQIDNKKVYPCQSSIQPIKKTYKTSCIQPVIHALKKNQKTWYTGWGVFPRNRLYMSIPCGRLGMLKTPNLFMN